MQKVYLQKNSGEHYPEAYAVDDKPIEAVELTADCPNTSCDIYGICHHSMPHTHNDSCKASHCDRNPAARCAPTWVPRA